MLDIEFIRENVKLVKDMVKNKQKDPSLVDRVLEFDEKRRKAVAEIEVLRQKRNILSQGSFQSLGEGKEIKEKLKLLEPELQKVEEEFFNNLYLIPNLYLDDVPVGKDEGQNQPIRKWGEIKKLDFVAKDHVELGRTLNIIDNEKASEVVGNRFTYLKGDLALMQFALISYVLKILTDPVLIESLAHKIDPNLSAKIFVPVVPPVMIKPEVYTKMARLDANQEEERYYLPKDNLYLIGSAEHTLGPLHMGEILNEDQLPIRYIGYSTAFRREAGSYGKDVKGILRVHQFDKLEMESFCLPETSVKEQDFFVAVQEHIMQTLKIPYQIVMICTGDMGGPDARQLDLESWMPGENKYRETHTADLMTDYQSRRLATRFKRNDGRSELVHMNDATACAIGRTLIAILENYQNADGSVTIPEVLRAYVGKDRILPPSKLSS